jgi:hypothetical protein
MTLTPQDFVAKWKRVTAHECQIAQEHFLDPAHRKLDAAVLSAYGWPQGLSNEKILERLLKLNLDRAG